MLFAASHLLVYSYVLHDACIYKASRWDSKWVIYTVFNSLAYLCEHFNVALHLLPHVTVNAGHKLGCAQSVISLPFLKKEKKEKSTARALAVESLCTCLPFCPVSRLPAIHPKKGSARPAWSPALKYASVEGCSPPCPVWGAQGTTPGSSGTPASTSITSKFHKYHTNTTHWRNAIN